MKRATALALLVLAAGCGGDSDSPTVTPVPSPTPVPCSQASVLGPLQGSIPSLFVVKESFATSSAGRVDVFVDWTFADSPIGVYVVLGNCDLDQFNARSCNFLLRSEPPGTKPRRVSVPNMAAGTYDLLIANFADVDESASTQVFLSTGSCAPFSASPPSGTAVRQAPARAIGVLRH